MNFIYKAFSTEYTRKPKTNPHVKQYKWIRISFRLMYFNGIKITWTNKLITLYKSNHIKFNIYVIERSIIIHDSVKGSYYFNFFEVAYNYKELICFV